MNTYTVEYQLHAKEQTSRTVEIELSHIPDMKDNEQLHQLYQAVSDAIREPVTSFEIVSVRER